MVHHLEYGFQYRQVFLFGLVDLDSVEGDLYTAAKAYLR